MNKLTNDQITDIWEAMPGQPGGWLKEFGYIQFARAIETEVAGRFGAKAGKTSLAGIPKYEWWLIDREEKGVEYVKVSDVERLLSNAAAGEPALPVTDEMVESAIEAFNDFPCPENGSIARSWNRDHMRAALEAAFAIPPLTAPAPLADEQIKKLQADIAKRQENINKRIAALDKADTGALGGKGAEA